MPLQNQLHVDQLLSNVSIKYRNGAYQAMNVFPELPVKKDSDKYRVYDRSFKLPETKRAPKAVAREHTFECSTASYQLEWHALKDYVGDREAENFDAADLRADVVEELSDKILLRLEKSVMDLFTTASWSLNVSLAAANQWNLDTTVSNPIPYVDTGCSTVLANAGVKPNFGLLNREGLVAIKNHVSIIDRVKYTQKEIDQNVIATLFGLPELLVSEAGIDTAAKGLAASVSSILGDVMFLGYKPASPGPMKLSSGYVFRNSRPMVKRWREEEREADAIEVNMEFSAKIVASLTGYLIKNIT